MTEINKIGINPQSKYNTPLGVYSYPLTKEYYSKLITNTLPFAGNKQYINLFSISDKTNNLNNYNNLEHDLNILKKYYKDNVHYNKASDNLLDLAFNKIKTHAFSTAFQKNDVSRFWNLTKILSKTPLKWNSLFRQLGYTNFYDPGEKIIHKAEPTQCVIFDPRIIIPIETFLNPYYSVKSSNIQKPITNIAEQDINNILKLKNKDLILKFDDSIFRSLKPYQIVYILENNLLLSHANDKIKDNIYIDKDLKLLKHVLKHWLKDASDYILNKAFEFALKHGISNIVTKTNNIKSGKFLLCMNNNITYYENNQVHREDGPAFELSNGDKYWFKNGKLHREDNPACEYASGAKWWYKNGKLHRKDGPAIELADGEKHWYLNNKLYGKNNDFTNESWQKFIKTQKNNENE